MAETDFGLFGSEAALVRRGVSAAFTPPPGGGSFVMGFRSLAAGALSTGFFYNKANFAPLRDGSAIVTGGSVRAAIMRRRSTYTTGYSVGIFMNLLSAQNTSTGYILGLSGNDPSHLVLAKTTPISGLSSDTSNAATLKVSSDSYLVDEWVHVRMDSIVNPNGDVVLKCYQNNLSLHTVVSPDWQVITEMEFIDDSLGVLSGSSPLGGGYVGYCFQSENEECVGLVDQFETYRQL